MSSPHEDIELQGARGGVTTLRLRGDEAPVYATVCNIVLTPEECILHFGLRDEDDPSQGASVGKVVISLAHAKRLAQVLGSSVSRRQQDFEIAADTIPHPVEAQVRDLVCADDWDGEGAVGVSSETVDAAIKFLRTMQAEIPALPDPESVSPSTLGAVAFSWRNDRRVLMIEVASADADSFYHLWRGEGSNQRSFGFVDRDQLVQLLRDVYA